MTDGLTRGPDKDVHVPGVGSTKVPFSWCRSHILVIDYRWGSMGSNETAMAATGGPRVIAYLTGTGCHRDQIISFFCKAPGICETQENTSVDPVSGEPLYPKCTAENLACRCCDGQEAKSDGSCENFANACSNNPSIDCTDRPVTATCGFGNTCVPVEDGPCAVETITCSDARSDARSDAIYE